MRDGKHMRRCSPSLALRNMKVKTATRNQRTPMRTAGAQDRPYHVLTRRWGDWTSHTGGMQGHSHFGNSLAASQKVRYAPATQPRFSTPRYSPKKNENLCPHKSLYVHVYSSFIHNHPKLENNLKMLRLGNG